MSLLEETGEKAIAILHRCLYYAAGFSIWLLKLLRRIKFYQHFEKKGIEPRDYLILKAQVSTVIFLLVVVLFDINLLGAKFFAAAAALSGGYSLFLIFVGMKEHLGEDVVPYWVFFLSFMGFAPGLLLVKAVKPISSVTHYLWLIAFSLFYCAVLWGLFRKKYGRDYTFGRVLEGGGLLKVKVNYDLCAGVKPGVFTLENKIKARAGDIVRLRVTESLFNLRGNSVIEAIAVVK